MIIDSYTARKLLEILALEKEANDKDIEWALQIIHQIPGYERISLAKAAKKRTKVKSPKEVSPISAEIKEIPGEKSLFRISPDTFQGLTSKVATTPFQLVSFFA